MTSDAQYQRDNNLATRIAFHEDYTSPYVDFSHWVMDNLPVTDSSAAEVEAVVEYIKSTASLFLEPHAVLEACDKIRSKIEAVIDHMGVFTISKQAGLFRCQ